MSGLYYQLYNDLPSLEDAYDNISSKKAHVTEYIRGPIRDLFLKHSTQDQFGLYLQHRHHTIGDGQVIVKVDGTSHVMDTAVMNVIINHGNAIIPSTWALSGGMTSPTEFSVVPASSIPSLPQPSKEFAEELSSILHAGGYNGVFGLESRAKSNLIELTIGSASVVVPDIGNHIDNSTDALIPVAFAFSPDWEQEVVVKKCNHAD